ncbi:hypothetical protein DSL72_006730 [Monilinia vaccinii-corymbosi]|uniref:Amine oxidase domain-containing protein n=1 Tax=Monilinia vaccinii-corymbosi TaxID=61207 RepID=A0A8A3PMZ9_9HELO|nr:hypothetical protein DSL72_006730 [Monilinia vaccinii-corymbosi]
MVLLTSKLLLLASTTVSIGAVTAKVTNTHKSVTINHVSYHKVECIERDVVVVGGGSSGTYAAIGLIDAKKSVAVIDNHDRMGGHTNTYKDPTTGHTEDYGVMVFHDIDLVKQYAARLNVTLALNDRFNSTASTVYADFRTGIQNSTYSTSIDALTTGFERYAAQLQKYPYVETGFDLPSPVPEDLLLCFGDFAIKYQLGNEFVAFLFSFAQGLGDFLSKPTLYVFKNVGMGVLENFNAGFLSTPAHDNSLIYKNAQGIIGEENVFLNSKIVAVNRSGHCAQVLISTPSGYKFIDAKKLVFTIPPKIHNLAGWDLSASEKTLFSQFNSSGYYSGVFGNTGLPTGVSVMNVADNTPYGLPPLPAGYIISSTAIPKVFNLYFGSPTSLTDDDVRAAMLAELHKLRIANMTDSYPKLLAYARHEPFELWVPAEAIAAGFYRELYGLQGQRNTFYTGAAFHTHDSSLLWEFTEALIPKITASLS